MTADAPIRPTSAVQADATRAGTVAAPEDIDADTFVVPLPTGFPAFILSTLCYVLRDSSGSAHVIDPGIGKPPNLDLLLGELRARGIDRVASVTATHMHPDHLGLAELVRERTGARLQLGRVESRVTEAAWRNGVGRERALDEWGVPDDARDELRRIPDALDPSLRLDADGLIDDGDELEIPGRSIRAMLTPGHTPGHVCFVEDAARRVFTGDHVLPHINPGLGLGHPFDGNPMTIGISALERFVDDELSTYEALPGHGYRFTGLGPRAHRIVEHHRARSAEVGGVVARMTDASVWEIASQISWTAGWDGLQGFHRLSALAQTALHVDRIRRGDASGAVTTPGHPPG